jgi:hypothetical protein
LDRETARARLQRLMERRRDAASSARAAAEAYSARAENLTRDQRDLMLSISEQNAKRADDYEQDAEALEEILKWT